MMSWISEQQADVRLRVHVQPRSSRTEVVGMHGDALKIRLAAPPVDGAANDELIRFLAEHLDIPRSRVSLTAGSASRVKTVLIEGVSAAVVRQRLELG